MKEPKDKSRIHVHLAKGDKNIKNLKGAALEQEITIQITGKISGFREDEWDNSTNLDITPGSIKVVVEPISLSGAMKKSTVKV